MSFHSGRAGYSGPFPYRLHSELRHQQQQHGGMETRDITSINNSVSAIVVEPLKDYNYGEYYNTGAARIRSTSRYEVMVQQQHKMRLCYSYFRASRPSHNIDEYTSSSNYYNDTTLHNNDARPLLHDGARQDAEAEAEPHFDNGIRQQLHLSISSTGAMASRMSLVQRSNINLVHHCHVTARSQKYYKYLLTTTTTSSTLPASCENCDGNNDYFAAHPTSIAMHNNSSSRNDNLVHRTNINHNDDGSEKKSFASFSSLGSSHSSSHHKNYSKSPHIRTTTATRKSLITLCYQQNWRLVELWIATHQLNATNNNANNIIDFWDHSNDCFDMSNTITTSSIGRYDEEITVATGANDNIHMHKVNHEESSSSFCECECLTALAIACQALAPVTIIDAIYKACPEQLNHVSNYMSNRTSLTGGNTTQRHHQHQHGGIHERNNSNHNGGIQMTHANSYKKIPDGTPIHGIIFRFFHWSNYREEAYPVFKNVFNVGNVGSDEHQDQAQGSEEWQNNVFVAGLKRSDDDDDVNVNGSGISKKSFVAGIIDDRHLERSTPFEVLEYLVDADMATPNHHALRSVRDNQRTIFQLFVDCILPIILYHNTLLLDEDDVYDQEKPALASSFLTLNEENEVKKCAIEAIIMSPNYVESMVKRWIDLFRKIVKAFPEACTITNVNGRYPIVSIIQWEGSPFMMHHLSDLWRQDVCNYRENIYGRPMQRSRTTSDSRQRESSDKIICKRSYKLSIERIIAQFVRIAVEAQPSSLYYSCSSFGCTPLHYAVIYRRGYNVIKVLIDAASRDSRVTTSLCMLRNNMGELPLHIASMLCAPTRILMLLLGNGPPEAALVIDRGGRCAVHWAWIRLVDSDRNFGVSRNLRRNIPDNFNELQDSFLRKIQDCRTYDDRIALLGPGWIDVETLLRAAFHGIVCEEGSIERRTHLHFGFTDEDSALQTSLLSYLPNGKTPWRVAHAATSVCCPRGVLLIATLLHPEQLGQRDDDGRLPLHIALEITQSNGLPSSLWMPDRGQPSVLYTVVSAYPEAARVKDRSGRLPLHHAIALSLANDSPLRLSLTADLRSILKAYPEALNRRNVNLHGSLFPFMVAAFGPRASLNLTYELLMECPEVLDQRNCSHHLDDIDESDTYAVTSN